MPRKATRSPWVQLAADDLDAARLLADEGLYHKILDQYYIPTRYPDAVVGSLPKGLPARRHADEAIRLATEIFEVIRTAL